MDGSTDASAGIYLAMTSLSSFSELLRLSVHAELDQAGLTLSRRQREVLTDCLEAGLAKAIEEDARGDPASSRPGGAPDCGHDPADAERARLFAEEQRARRHAERMNRLKDEFLATVSHELRAPLQSILGWSRMLKSGALDAEGVLKGLDVIERNASMQAHLIEDILDVSKVIAGKVRIRTDVVDLARVLDTALETVRPAALAKGVTLAAEIDPHGSYVIMGDADRLQQIVWNLLANAVKFTPRGGRVTLSASRGDAQIDVAVVDDGVGISPDFLPFVFDRFRQAEGGSTRSHGGLGLGLAIVRHYAEAHGGSVSAESDGIGKGATFRVSLPIGYARPDAPPESRSTTDSIEPPPPASLALDGLRVLVVDDDDDARELLRIVLRQFGASVWEASNAHRGLALLREIEVDVIVSDVGMPGEDGHAFIRQVRALPTRAASPRIPALALTAYARSDDRRRALAAGFQMHLAKPVKPATLVAAIAQLSGRDPGLG